MAKSKTETKSEPKSEPKPEAKGKPKIEDLKGTDVPSEYFPKAELTKEEADAIPDASDEGEAVEPSQVAPAPKPVASRSVVSELPSSRKKVKPVKGGRKTEEDDMEIDSRSDEAKGMDILSQSASPVDSFKHIPSGVLSIDKATLGGWPRPMIIEGYSEEGVAKTTVALMAVKMVVLVLREHAIFLDYEHGTQLVYLDQLGIPYANLTVTDDDLKAALGVNWVAMDPGRIEAERQKIRRDRIANALKSKKALLWIFSPMSFEEGWDILRVLQGCDDAEGNRVAGVFPRPAALSVIDSYATMRPSMNIKFGDRPMQQGMMGSEFLSKIIHHLMKWDSSLFILNHLRTDVGQMMWNKHRPSYLPPPKKSFSSEVLKFVSQLRAHFKRAGGGTLEIEVMDTTKGEKSKVKVGHYVIMEQEKQKSHMPKPCQFLVMYGQGVDNVDLLIVLGVQKKFIEVGAKSRVNLGEWAPLTPDSKGKPHQPSFGGRREMAIFLRAHPDILKQLAEKIAAVEYLPLDSLIEIREDYNPETRSLKEPPTHVFYQPTAEKKG